MMETGKKTLEELMAMTHEDLISHIGKLQDELESVRGTRDYYMGLYDAYADKCRNVKDMVRSVSGMLDFYFGSE